MKNMVVILQDSDTVESTLDNALTLARTVSAHLHCVQLIPNETMVFGDGFGGAYVLTDLLKQIEDEAAELQKKFEQKLANEDVAWSFETLSAGLGWVMRHRAALADLVVVSRHPHRLYQRGSGVGRLGEALYASRSPIFIPGDGEIVRPNGRAVIGWDGSVEAAVAVRAAAPLLQCARDVLIIRIEEKDEKFPDTRVVEYLSRHDVHAELKVLPYNEDWLDEILLSAVREQNGYVVMGAYSRSRLGEFIFGGATRTMLMGSRAGVLMAH